MVKILAYETRWILIYWAVQFVVNVVPKDDRGYQLIMAIYPWLEQEAEYGKKEIAKIKARGRSNG